MFGYVAVNKPELKIRDYDKYRMYYCGVCHALRENHGVRGQIGLTYDAAFAAVLLTALYEPRTKAQKRTCMVHPVGKKAYLENDAIRYVADMNLVLAYYKCLDDWEDEKKLSRLAYAASIRRKVRKVGGRYSQKVARVRDDLRTLSALERKNVTNLDRLAGTFGDIMGEILAYRPETGEDWSCELRELGCQLGKFVYILDAYDDVAEDIEKKRFNPLVSMYETMSAEHFRETVREILMMIAADMAKSYECLPIVDETGILRNIVYSGIWVRFFRRGKDNTGGKEEEYEGSL